MWRLALIFFAFCSSVFAQGLIRTVRFEGPPTLPPTYSIGVTNYTEGGILASGLFGRSGGAEELEAFPRNGGAYIYAAFGDDLAISTVTKTAFSLLSVDLAEFSTLHATPLTVQFVGYRADGTVIVSEFITDGIIDGAGPLADFQTFYFSAAWTGLMRVEVPGYGWSMDNVVVGIPEPSNSVLLLLGIPLFRRLVRRRGSAALPQCG